MPIYAYKCASCGHAKDVLRKISDPPLTRCPACGAETFEKQVTAAGFQLKGSGWYATDFKGGNSGAPAAEKSEDGKTDAAKTDGAKTETAKTEGAKPADAKPADSAAKPAVNAPAPAKKDSPAASGGSGR